ncbi:hypothetical protein CI109_105154 [Kwoniella shandongensis]|uniref:Uncharacterized protein n=1 Tax=Kwoniella shandongensis TaxID=1734106 RepID=A0A5M6C352_9TREE|nr:uncharacterized protein CI109_001993 [Kwoniella shandongensis]KAA5529568.1 hypothetical protein CI109_001993 [Kwoniella shandongensis]
MSDLTATLIPSLPHSNSTLPLSTTRVPIAPISCWSTGQIPTVLTFPEELDLERLRSAIGLLTSVWPTLAGRFERSPKKDEEWSYDYSFNLTTSSIPLSTQTITIPSHQTFPFANRQIIQPSVNPFVPPLGEGAHVANSDAHLFAIRLTTILPSRSSVLGIVISHIIGDGHIALQIVKHLEGLYLYGEAALPIITKPTFVDHVILPPYDPAWDLPDDTLKGHDLADVGKAYVDAAENSEMVVIELTRAEIANLKAKYGRESGVRLSDQDVLSGWWVGLLERMGEKINTMIYVYNYRHFCISHPSFPSTLPTMAANVAQMRFISLPAHETTSLLPSSTAKLIRETIEKLRSDPDITLPWLSNAAFHIGKACDEGKGQIMVPKEGKVVINSNIRMDWHTSFGFPPHQSTFHTTFSTIRFLRVFQANPCEGEERGERVEVVFSVPKGGANEAVERLVDADRRAWNV